MGMELKKAFRWQIDNFSEKSGLINSIYFSFGGTKWILAVLPKINDGCDYLCPILCIGNSNSLKLGWKKRVRCVFVYLNQSEKEICRSPSYNFPVLFCAETQGWCVQKMFPLTKIQKKGFLDKDKLIIEVYIQILEVVHHGKSTANELVIVNGFHMKYSQCIAVYDILMQHPDFAKEVKPKNHGVKTAYMNLLLHLIETLNKSPENLFGTELNNAKNDLSELTEAGFKLDWLKSKLENITLERIKALSDGTWVQQLENRVKVLPEIKHETFSEFIKRLFLSWFPIFK